MRRSRVKCPPQPAAGKAPRVEGLADQERAHPRWAAAQLEVVDAPAAAPIAVEDLLVEQAVGDEERLAGIHPPPPLVIISSGIAAIARRTITPK